MKNGVSIVIPNYNGEDIIIQTIDFAVDAIKTSLIGSYEIIVSDDASSDRSVELIKEFCKEVIIVESKINTGFSGNVNRGVKIATKELVLILNSDLRLGKGYFNSLLPIFENDKVFGVMGSTRDPVTSDCQDGAKLPIINFGLFITSNKNRFSKTEITPTLFLSGANALVRKDYFLELNGFCELFNPYYSEDVDLGIRAWRMGWELYFQPNATCYHKVSSTIKKISKEKVIATAKRNKHILHALHLPKALLIIYDINLILITSFRIVMGDKIYFQALKNYFGLKKEIRNERVKFANLNNCQKKHNLFEAIKKIKNLELN